MRTAELVLRTIIIPHIVLATILVHVTTAVAGGVGLGLGVG